MNDGKAILNNPWIKSNSHITISASDIFIAAIIYVREQKATEDVVGKNVEPRKNIGGEIL